MVEKQKLKSGIFVAGKGKVFLWWFPWCCFHYKIDRPFPRLPYTENAFDSSLEIHFLNSQSYDHNGWCATTRQISFHLSTSFFPTLYERESPFFAKKKKKNETPNSPKDSSQLQKKWKLNLKTFRNFRLQTFLFAYRRFN